jgi:histidyl-tRNA synthetase
MQFDIDIVGTKNLLADAEIIAAMVSTLEHLDVKRFEVRYSNRKLLNGVVTYAGIDPERGPDVMRVIDKLDKQGKQAVLEELGPGRTDVSGDKIPGLKLPDSQIAALERFLDVAAQATDDPLRAAMDLVGDIAIAHEGIDELKRIQSYLTYMGIDDSKTRVDLTIVRGLGYYTGPIFETTLLDLPQYGSVFSGGRYDNLVERFMNVSVPATGSSIGIDRLLAALLELNALQLKRATADALVTTMDRERIPDYLQIVRELRAAGIATEIFVGDSKNLTKQVKYGDKVGVQFAVIAGSDEFEAGQVTVKDLRAGERAAYDTSDREEWLKAEGFQETIPRSELIDYLRRHLSARAK